METIENQIEMKKEEMIELIKKAGDRPILLLVPHLDGGSDIKQVYNNTDDKFKLFQSAIGYLIFVCECIGMPIEILLAMIEDTEIKQIKIKEN